MSMITVCKAFEQLTPDQLYDALRLRSEVFVVEQHCVFLDMDNKDRQSYHLLLYGDALLLACARLLPPGLSYQEMSIGRIVTSPQVRGKGLGKVLVAQAIETCYALFVAGPIKIGAQLYAKAFYEQFGFVQAGQVYDEDGIDHIPMIRV
jgi:ElaA protein